MYNLFDLGPDVAQPIFKMAQWRMIRDGLRRNVAQVIEYYRLNPQAVKSDHFLVRLLQSISVSRSMNLERYYDNVDGIALPLSMALNMTSALYKGATFDGIFYGRGCKEVLVAQSQDWNLEQAHRNWENLVAVKVIKHPVTSLGLDLPDGSRPSVWNSASNLNTTGALYNTAVIMIDIPLLAIQYRAFRQNETQISAERGYDDSERSMMQFIRMYVLPNMLQSHLDLVVFNRLDAIKRGLPLESAKNKHPFVMPDYTLKIDQALTEIISRVEKMPRDFQGILKSIPAIFKDNLYQVMDLPRFPPTRQIIWAMVLSRIEVLFFLFAFLDDGARTRNGKVVNHILHELRMYRSAKIMDSVLPRGVMVDIDDGIMTTIDSANRQS